MVLICKAAAPQREGRCYKPLHQGEDDAALGSCALCGIFL